MRLTRRMLAVAVVGFLLLVWSEQARAGYSVEFRASEDGHLKMWWTKQGVRISEYPFIDNDVTKGAIIRRIAPADDINDDDTQWIRSGGKTSYTNALAGAGYQYERFEDYLAVYGPSVTWFSLRDETDLSDVAVQVDLVVWGEYLRTHTLPDPAMIFMFDPTGQCPLLPGYKATNLTTMASFVGPMVAVGMDRLVIPEPATLSLLALGGLALLRRRPRK
jgi:hypothetical protein